MPLLMRTTSSHAAHAIAVELSTEGFLARVTCRKPPLVVVNCATNEYDMVAQRIRRRDPGSTEFPLNRDAVATVP